MTPRSFTLLVVACLTAPATGSAQIILTPPASACSPWFESFQNWQSEFLAVGSMVVLSIWLRQKGSPESKPVDAPHSQTGKD